MSNKLRSFYTIFSLAFMLLGGIFAPTAASAAAQYDVVVPCPQPDRSDSAKVVVPCPQPDRSAGTADSALTIDADVGRDSRDGDVARLSKDGDVALASKDGDVARLSKDEDVALASKEGDVARLTKDGDVGLTIDNGVGRESIVIVWPTTGAVGR